MLRLHPFDHRRGSSRLVARFTIELAFGPRFNAAAPNACVHRAEKAAATTARKTPPIFTAAFSARVQHIVSSIVLSSYVCRSFTYALMLFSQEITREFSCMSVNLMNDVTSSLYCKRHRVAVSLRRPVVKTPSGQKNAWLRASGIIYTTRQESLGRTPQACSRWRRQNQAVLPLMR